MNTEIMWYIVFFLLFIGFLLILIASRDKKYFYYFIAGSIFGFYFDIVSFTFGYYSYPLFYKIQILGIPFGMTLAEGFSVAILIFAVERYAKVFLKKYLKIKI